MAPLPEEGTPETASSPSAAGSRARRRRRWLIGVVAALGIFCVWNRRWLTINDITTGETPEYPDLPAHVYAADLPTTRAAAEAACRSLPRWRLVPVTEADHAHGALLHAEVRTLLFSFVDDVTVRFIPLPQNGPALQTRVVIRSHSRVGRGDLGENARHIAALQAAMDARLPCISKTES